jgi:hypothetical protein
MNNEDTATENTIDSSGHEMTLTSADVLFGKHRIHPTV